MNYTEALEFIHTRERFSSPESMRRLCAALGNPQKKLKFIHIAGTNGKGSVSAYVSSCLREAGYRTGTFISPYIYDFCERIQIDGEPIHRDDLCRLTEKIASVRPDAAEFELVTAIGFCLFAERQCDYVVLEVGLGGRSDQTNVIDCPEAACITLIDFDHTALLGCSIEEIAYEKCGIIKGGNVISYPSQRADALKVIKRTCEETGSRLHIADMPEVTEMSVEGTSFEYKGGQYRVSMLGSYQPYNAATAIEVLTVLGVDKKHIKSGLEKTHFAGRFEFIHKNPYIIIDGGHNESGMREIARSAEAYFGRFNMVMGMAADKDWEKCIGIIAPLADKLVLTKPDTPRAWDLPEAERVARRYCKNVVVRENISDAVDAALGDLPVIIGGSLFLVGKAAEYVRICM